MKKSASDREVYKSRVIWTPMSRKQQQKTLSSLADSQRVGLPGAVAYNETRNRERGEGNMSFVYNENKVPLPALKVPFLNLVLDYRWRVFCFGRTFRYEAAGGEVKPLKNYVKVLPPNCRCPRYRGTNDLTRPLQNQLEKNESCIRSKSAKPN